MRGPRDLDNIITSDSICIHIVKKSKTIFFYLDIIIIIHNYAGTQHIADIYYAHLKSLCNNNTIIIVIIIFV